MPMEFNHNFSPASIDKMSGKELGEATGLNPKNKTKAQMQDQLLTIYHDWLSEHPVKKATAKVLKSDGTSTPKGASQKVSANKDSAASKKCNLLRALALGKKTEAIAIETWTFDTVLQAYWPQEQFVKDVAAALTGDRPKSGGKGERVTISVDIGD